MHHIKNMTTCDLSNKLLQGLNDARKSLEHATQRRVYITYINPEPGDKDRIATVNFFFNKEDNGGN